MNPLSYELELYALAVLLYLSDTTLLLYGNEAILTHDGPKTWSASWGWSGFSLAGRTVCLLNPFAPHQASFRLSWNFRNPDAGITDREWPELAQRLRTIAPWAILAGIALFVILPFGLFSALGAYALGTALVILYGSLAVALYRLHRERSLLARAGKSFWSFAFECLACPPFGVNMLRRITLALRVEEPLPIAAQRLLDAPHWAALREECLSRLDVAMQSSLEGSPEYLALAEHKRWLRDYAGRPCA